MADQVFEEASRDQDARPQPGTTETATPSEVVNPWLWYYAHGPDTECCWELGAMNSVEEAIAEAVGVGGFEPGDTFTVVEATKGQLPAPEASCVVEAWQESLDDSDGGYFGEDAGDWRKFPLVEAEADLQAALDAWANRWRPHFPPVWSFAQTRHETTTTLPQPKDNPQALGEGG